MSASPQAVLDAARGLVRHRQPDPVRRGDAAQVAEQSQQVAERPRRHCPVRVVWKPVLTDSDSIRRLALEANARDDVDRRHRVDAHVQPGEDVDRRARRAAASRCCTCTRRRTSSCRGATIDFDFMNLNQAAHGDREFGYIQTRLGVARKTVVGHVSNPRVRRQVEDWQRAAAGWAASRSLKLARFGDNMRYVAVTEGDKTEAELRFGVQVNTWGVNELAEAVDAASDADVDALVAEYVDALRRRARAAAGRRPARVAARRRRDRARPALVPRGAAASAPSPRRFEDLGALKQLPGLAVQRLMAEGYGFGAEGDWKTADPRARRERHGRRPARWREPHGGLHLRPRARRRADPRRAHARGLAVAHHRRSRASRCTRSASAARRTRCAWSSPPTPAPRVVVAMSDMRDRFRLVANVVENVDAPDLPNLPVGRAVWKPAPDFATSRRLLARRRRRAPHGDDDRGRHRGVPRLRRDRQDRARRHRRATPPCAGSSASCAGTRRTTDWPRASEPDVGCARTDRPSRHGRDRRHRALRSTLRFTVDAGRLRGDAGLHDEQRPVGRAHGGGL